MPRLEYERINWQNAPSTETPINAENLNTMDNAIAALFSYLGELEERIDNLSMQDASNMTATFGEPGEEGVDEAPLQPSGSILKNIITGVHSRIRALFSSVSDINASITDLNANVTNLNGDISDLNTTLTTEISNVDAKANGILSHSKVLWSGDNVMGAGSTINLSENITGQFSGIVLVWSGYSGGEAKDYQWQYNYVSKEVVALNPGHGVTCILAGASFNPIGTKYVYINNDNIAGSEYNTQSGTRNGIAYSNGSYTLRYVIGV